MKNKLLITVVMPLSGANCLKVVLKLDIYSLPGYNEFKCSMLKEVV